MTDDFRERYGGWALVTGASSGIGEAFAEALAARGFPVVLVARRQDRLDALSARLREAYRVETVVVAMDLAAPGACERVREAVGAREVGFLVNNAGFGFSGRFAERDAEADERMILLNCAAVVRMTHTYLPQMVARRRGGIVVVASTAGYQSTPWFAVYGATKAFDLHFAEALWCELRGSGVDVVALSPGETRTEFAEHAHMGRKSGGHEPAAVVAKALAALGRQPSVVPGLKNKLTAFAYRLLPRRLVTTVTGTVLARELLRTTSAALRRLPYR